MRTFSENINRKNWSGTKNIHSNALYVHNWGVKAYRFQNWGVDGMTRKYLRGVEYTFRKSKKKFLPTSLLAPSALKFLVAPFSVWGIFYSLPTILAPLAQIFGAPPPFGASALKIFCALPLHTPPPYELSDHSLRIIQPHLWLNDSYKNVCTLFGEMKVGVSENILFL